MVVIHLDWYRSHLDYLATLLPDVHLLSLM